MSRREGGITFEARELAARATEKKNSFLFPLSLALAFSLSFLPALSDQARLEHHRRRRGATSVSGISFVVALDFSLSSNYSSGSSDGTSFASSSKTPRRRRPACKARRDVPLGATRDGGPLQARPLWLPFPHGGVPRREEPSFPFVFCCCCEPRRQLCRLLLGCHRRVARAVHARGPGATPCARTLSRTAHALALTRPTPAGQRPRHG